MDQKEKQALIDAASETAIKEVARVLQIAPTRESVRPAMELAMGSELMKLYKLCVYFAVEADRFFEQKTFFASCLFTVAASEAFLALICFHEQDSVRSTKAFRGLNKQSKTFSDVIADFSLSLSSSN